MVRSSLCFVILVLGGSPAAEAAGPWAGMAVGESVAAQTFSGRTVRGAVDARTTDERLWLTVEEEGVTITCQLDASEVASVSPAEPVTMPPVWQDDEVATHHGYTLEQQVSTVQVRSLHVAAQAGNWDADPHADGIRLWVRPTGQDNLVTPVAGAVQVELLLADSDSRGRSSFRTHESWRRSLTADLFTADGAVLELPFNRVDPESFQESFPMAVLRVRLLAPGEGAFDALVTDLPLRAYSWNRDRQQRWTGQRALPGE